MVLMKRRHFSQQNMTIEMKQALQCLFDKY